MTEHKVPGVLGRRLYKVLEWGGSDYDDTDRQPVDNVDEANVVSSQLVSSGRHALVIDLDVPAELVPSSTPGNSHLYIDVSMAWPKALAILEALTDANVVERGYLEASRRRGFSCVRLPWVKKESKQ